MGIHTLALIILENETESLDTKSLSDNIVTFHVLKLGKIQEELMKI